MSENPRPYTIPYTGSVSRGASEGFAPATQPPPPKNMGRMVATPYKPAAMAENPPQPSYSGAGPSMGSYNVHEPASNAYLGPAKYRSQPTVTYQPAQEHHVPQTSGTTTKAPQNAASDAKNDCAKKNESLHKSMDGTADEAEIARIVAAHSDLQDLLECRRCRLSTLLNDGKRPDSCENCSKWAISCTFCNCSVDTLNQSSPSLGAGNFTIDRVDHIGHLPKDEHHEELSSSTGASNNQTTSPKTTQPDETPMSDYKKLQKTIEVLQNKVDQQEREQVKRDQAILLLMKKTTNTLAKNIGATKDQLEGLQERIRVVEDQVGEHDATINEQDSAIDSICGRVAQNYLRGLDAEVRLEELLNCVDRGEFDGAGSEDGYAASE